MLRSRFKLFSLALMLHLPLSLVTYASVVMPGDGPYYSLRHNRTHYVFDESAREVVGQLIAYTDAIRAQYDQSYGWRLDEDMDLILTSPRQQIANGYATVYPNIKTVWFPSGSALLEPFAQSSWMLALATHETAHLYQLNAKRGLNEKLTPVFGNAITVFPFFWPIVVHPNLLTPGFILEGNAVMNESRMDWGGRLHSGEARALVYAQIQAGDIDANRLINEQFKFPFGQVSYLQGGYFQAHLAAKHGVDAANRFFVAQGSHYLWPLILNKTFRDHFGASYNQEIREYVRATEVEAAKQTRTRAEPLARRRFFAPLNHDADRVFFLATDGETTPELFILDKPSRAVNTRRRDLLMGKVFWLDDQPYTAATFERDLRHVSYSLYGEGARLHAGFLGQIVTDRRGGKTAAYAASHSWLDPLILVNGESFDIGHSEPILDESGNVYYFRQIGAERVLFRNRQPVFKFAGFYGKLTEATADGSVYFIANTPYGSSLYRFHDFAIDRMFASDRIVDARQISGDEFLVVEVHHDGHTAAIVRAAPELAQPATYAYGFASERIQPAELPAPLLLTQLERPYHATREMRYAATESAFYYSDESGLGGILQALFTDPLQFQQLGLGVAWNGGGDHTLSAGYVHTKYLLDPFVRYIYDVDRFKTQGGRTRTDHDQAVRAGVILPLLRARRWDAQAAIAAAYDRDDLGAEFNESHGLVSSAELTFRVPTMLGFHPWREWRLGARNRLDSFPNEWRKRYNTSIVSSNGMWGLGREFYAGAWGGLAWAERRDIPVIYNPSPLIDTILVPRLTSGVAFDAKTAGYARVELTKAVTTVFTSARIPLGLNRIAPFVVAQGIVFDRSPSGGYPANVFEYGYGMDLELLLLHRAPARLRVLRGYDTREPNRATNELRLGFSRDF